MLLNGALRILACLQVTMSMQEERPFQEAFLRANVKVTDTISLDHSFKVSKKMFVRNTHSLQQQQPFKATITVWNKYGEVLAQRLVPTTEHKWVRHLLWDIRNHCETMKEPLPQYCWTDNCCHDRNMILSVFPDIQVE